MVHRGRALAVGAALLLAGACQRKPPVPALPLQALRVALSSEAELHKLGPAADDAVRRPFAGPIIQVLLVEETPGEATAVPRQRAAGSGMTTDALFERALANLRAASTQTIKERTVAMARANVSITRFGGDDTAARLLLPELWAPYAAGAGGKLFAAAPVRDLLVWTTSVAEEDQRALRGQARTAFQSRSHPISPAILRWTGGGWALEDPNPIPGP
jgi:hypothetical protein